MNTLGLRLPSLLFAAALLAGNASAQVIYVDAGLNTGLNDGSSWADALQGIDGLKAALDPAVAGDQVFVAQGTYRPSSTGARGGSFRMHSGVDVYGGFLGGETSPDQRPPFGSAPSILTGDLNGDDAMGQIGDNSWHVVRASGSNSGGVLDGFRITAGNADGASFPQDRGGGILVTGGGAVIRNCHFIGNRSNFGGGAGFVDANSRFTDVIFEDNDGGFDGGALLVFYASPRLDRCSFFGNRANRAGALELFGSNSYVTNCLFQGNTSDVSGGGAIYIGPGSGAGVHNCTVVDNHCSNTQAGGIRVFGADPTITNCILWNNTGSNGAQDAANQVTQAADVTYSIVEGGMAGLGNLSSDPKFADHAAGNYRLTLASSAIDAGSNPGVPIFILLDANSQERFVDEISVPDTGNGTAPVVDMGAYEFQGDIGTGDPGCSPLANSTGMPSTLAASGSLTVSENNLSLLVAGLPTSQFGYFLMSESNASLPVGSGVLCLGAPQYRFSGNVLGSGAGGLMSFSPDLGNLPQNQTFLPGSTWYFQLWHRDGASSNFSGSLGFTWQ